MNRSALLGLGLLAAGLFTAGDALAQSNPVAIQPPGARQPKPRTGNRSDVAPPALPGARAEPTAIAPAVRNAMEMAPNEALFDAINRGDLAVAKDALNRGADLNGTNVLGLTPLELAVDLGRNEISFLLLSLRGGAGYNTRTGPAVAARPPTRAERAASDRAERAERAGRTRAAAAQPALPAAPQTARLFAGQGGAPVPQAGFLGFDAAR